MDFNIEPLCAATATAYREHAARHRAESGRGDPHFMPFAPEDSDGPRLVDLKKLVQPLEEPGWERRWIAQPAGQDQIVGHVDLKSDFLKTGIHRCELGIGIERPFRGFGLGRELMLHAIAFARAAPSLIWVDLRVFGHNTNARKLYASLGFQETGVLQDRFRIEGTSIDDVLMSLRVADP